MKGLIGQRSDFIRTHTSLGSNPSSAIYMLCDLGMSLPSLSLMLLNLENVAAVAVETNIPKDYCDLVVKSAGRPASKFALSHFLAV